MAWQQQQHGPYDSPYSDAVPSAPLQNSQNGFKSHDGLDDDAFGAKGSIVSAFDAFRKHSSFVTSGHVECDTMCVFSGTSPC